MNRYLPQRLLPLCLAICLAGCANYEFDQARRADGTWDIPKLVRDLEASEDDSLFEGIWIPLLYTDFTVFTVEDVELPGGYKLGELTSVGPLFFAGSGGETLLNSEQAEIESCYRWWGALGIGAHGKHETVETTAGTRTTDSWRALLILGDQDSRYPRDVEAPQ